MTKNPESSTLNPESKGQNPESVYAYFPENKTKENELLKITALFNNMRTLKYKRRAYNCAFAAVNHKHLNLGKQKDTKRIEIHQSENAKDDFSNSLIKILRVRQR